MSSRLPDEKLREIRGKFIEDNLKGESVAFIDDIAYGKAFADAQIAYLAGMSDEETVEEWAKILYTFINPDFEWGHRPFIGDTSWEQFEEKCTHKARKLLALLQPRLNKAVEEAVRNAIGETQEKITELNKKLDGRETDLINAKKEEQERIVKVFDDYWDLTFEQFCTLYNIKINADSLTWHTKKLIDSAIKGKGNTNG